jgi:putative transposase
MIDRGHALSITRQAKALGISRSGLYTLPRPVSDADLALMRRIDELHLDYPFAGSRMLQGLLAAEGRTAGRLHVSTLMKRMGIEAIYRRPNTSKPEPGHKIFPYLLRKLPVTRPNQVWAMDLTYIPMARGFVYLAALPGERFLDGLYAESRIHGDGYPPGEHLAAEPVDDGCMAGQCLCRAALAKCEI